MLWTFDRGDAGSKPPIAVTELGNFVHPTLFFGRYSKSRSSFLPGVYVISLEEKWKQIYRGLTNSRVGSFGTELNNYINCFNTETGYTIMYVFSCNVFRSLKSVFISCKDITQNTAMSHRARLSSLYH